MMTVKTLEATGSSSDGNMQLSPLSVYRCWFSRTHIAESVAKLNLRCQVDVSDALLAINLMEETLLEQTGDLALASRHLEDHFCQS